MAYSPPTFNLVCDVYSGTGPGFPTAIPAGPPRIVGQVFQMKTPKEAITSINCFFEFPAGTDLRFDPSVTGSGLYADVFEFPVGSGQGWFAQYVYDVARGFTNEYRRVLTTIIRATVAFPLP